MSARKTTGLSSEERQILNVRSPSETVITGIPITKLGRQRRLIAMLGYLIIILSGIFVAIQFIKV